MIKLIVCDMDGTLVQYESGDFQSSWDAIGKAAGKWPEWQAAVEKYYEGACKNHAVYEEWLKYNAGLLRGVKVDTVAEKIFPIPYSPGVKEFFSETEGKCRRGILTSGVDLVAEKIKQENSLEFCLANLLRVNKKGEFTGEALSVVGLQQKGERLRMLADMQGISLLEVCYIGDHENDLPAMEIAGFPVAFNPKREEVRKKAKAVIGDFRELLKYF
ncbi:MAG TPA: HAD family phosphatase [Candidatus Nanoarchaeia archaeon]|nr:HAD family phosphatase [Candidatus Nanoarchaeia archaeon]